MRHGIDFVTFLKHSRELNNVISIRGATLLCIELVSELEDEDERRPKC